jgi:arylsulfatase A-like enzyme
MLDSLRRDHVGAYRNDWIETPNIDALAAEGVRFTSAYPEALLSSLGLDARAQLKN